MNTQVRHIDIDSVRNLTRFTTDFDFTNYLLQKALLLTNANGIANEMHGHCDLDLLTPNQSLKVRMDQTSTNRINLPIVKHHFATGPALDFNRKDRVSASLRSQNCRQFL